METTLNPPCLWNVTEYVQVNEIWFQNSNCNKIVIAFLNVRAMSHLNQHKNYAELVAKSLSGHIYFSDDVSNCSSGIKMPLTFNTSVSKITIRYKLINISYWDMQEAYWNCFHHKLKFIINHKLTSMFNVRNENVSVRDHVFSYQCTRSYVSLLVHVIIIIMGSFYAK